ncbi:MAG: hypothetical protein IJM43_08230 [Bacteroidaceae bacterium]|nr:hypothetical protein [Bacteroidaceae bacterium]
MEYHLIKDLKRDIRIAMDENGKDESLLKDEQPDTLLLEEIITSSIPIAVRIVETIAPIQLLGWGESFSTKSIAWKGQPGYGSGYIILPDDFLRLVSFKMSDWDRAVTTLISETDPEYNMQHSRFAGVRGNPQQPVAAITNKPTGMALEFYSCSQGAGVTVEHARYIPQPRFKDDMIRFPMPIRNAVVYYTAYLTAQTLAQKDAAAHLLETAMQLLQMQNG